MNNKCAHSGLTYLNFFDGWTTTAYGLLRESVMGCYTKMTITMYKSKTFYFLFNAGT